MDGHVMTLANSIIGVSILAMPYCFKQCGIVLSIIILLISSIISRLACHFLLKSAIMARRKTFEFLALHIFGAIGKLAIEIGMIGFLLGTCIAFFVVMGDLGPEIISEIIDIKVTTTLRNMVLILLAFFCILPLGLLRNVTSFNGVSRATIGFYCCLVLKIIIEALPRIFIGDWFDRVILWKPDGLLQCLPIFSMALFCQTQLFEIYQEIPNASLEKMNSLIRVAVNICTWVYIFVGTFGYIAFCKKTFTGNILLSFPTSGISELIKIGFILSLVFSFPLVIFPCRASLYSLIYKEPTYTALHEGTNTNYIPEGKFKMLTLIIVTVSLLIALMIPNIELVLGLVGSTIGVMICVLFPVTCFICISSKNTNERILAQIMLFIGVIVMVLGTYNNLYAYEETKITVLPDETHHEQVLPNPPIENIKAIEVVTVYGNLKEKLNIDTNKETVEVRHEPPQPEEPNNNNREKPPIVLKETNDNIVFKPSIVENKQNPPSNIDDKNVEKQEPVVEPIFPQENNKKKSEDVKENKNQDNLNKIEQESDNIKEPITVKIPKSLDSLKNIERNITILPPKNDEVDIEAIKKEEIELKEQEKLKDPNQILIDTLQQHNEVQKEIVKQQKRLIEVIEKQQKQQQSENNNDNKKNDLNAEKVKAVKQIENIARKAIESISKQDKIISNNNNNRQISNLSTLIKNGKTDNNSIVENIDTKQQRMTLLPIPLAFANKANETDKNVEVNIINNKNNINNTTTVTSDNQKKNIRRDILSENLQRPKRDIDTRIDSTTEKSIIKMICNLSVPNLINVDLKHLETNEQNQLKDLQVKNIEN